jgi:hypothetical protein
LLTSEYILIRKYPADTAARFPAGAILDNPYIEAIVFELALAQEPEQLGVTVVSDSANLRLLKVVDRAALDRAFDQVMARYAWRREFIDANQRDWLTADSLPTPSGSWHLSKLDFGGVYLIHSLAISRTEKGLRVDVWWEETSHQEANAERYLFLHLLDASGNILVNEQIALFPYDPPDQNRRVHRSQAEFRFNTDTAPKKLFAALAFGIYRPNGEYLVADDPRSDWGGKRILIQLDQDGEDAKHSESRQ